jgi:carnitine O-acetyltransferase
MGKDEKTGKDVASIASKGLRDPGSLTKTEIKKISASVLTQAPDKPKPSKK